MPSDKRQWETGDIPVNDIRLHYTRTGGDKPPLVLAHGFSDDGLCWTPVAEALAPDFDVIMVDARGHGLSDAPAAGYGAFEQAADLTAVIISLKIKKPFILGHSMGAATTLVLAGTWPMIPGAILLEDPPASWVQTQSTSATPAPAPPRAPSWIQELAGKTREELMAEQRVKTPGWSEAEIGPWADAKLHFIPKADKRGPGVAVDWPTVLRNITCPALLITADPERGAIITPERASSLQAFVPQLQIQHIANAGHSIRRDQFAPYMEAVRTFLKEQNP